MSGKMSRSILEAFIKEDFNYEKTELRSFRSDVKNSIGTFLLQLGNLLSGPTVYTLVYNQSEAMLIAALELHPYNWQVQKNLNSVRLNRKNRGGILAVDTSTRPLQLDPSTIFSILSTIQANEKAVAYAPQLGFHDALQHALRGTVDDRVVESMRRELLRA